MAESIKFQLYSKLPVWVQNVACSLAGLNMRRSRHGRVFQEMLEFLRHSQWWSLEEQKAYQDEQLQRVIEHVYETVPYYREIFDERRLKPTDIQTVEDLPKLPILEKKTVRSRMKDLVSTTWPKKRLVHGHTGGTTGTSLQLISDIETSPWQWAVWWRHRERFGLKLHDPFVVFAGRSVIPLDQMKPPIWRRNWPMHQTYVSIHHITKQNLPILADYLCSRKVKFYSGYPSAVYLVAVYFLENKIRLPHPPAVVTLGAETLLPHQRRAIAEAFDSVVTDQYGASEMCGNISACEKGNYHVDMEFGAIEFLPLKNMPANARRIVCTGFWNMAMPLIRYDIGDIATLGDECDCGRAAPVVEKIDGRIESYVLTPDGRQLGRLDFLFKDSENIEEAQFVQYEISSVTLNLVVSPNYSSSDEKQLLDDMRRYLGSEIIIKPEYLKSIPREANGKFRQIISKVFQQQQSLSD